MTQTAPALDTRLHLTALLDLLNAELDPRVAYTYDEVPGSPYNKGATGTDSVPAIYAAVSVERRYVAPRRNDGSAGRTGWRASVRFVGRTMFETHWCEERVIRALNEQRITVDGNLSTPIQHETTAYPEWDAERWSGLVYYVYAV